MDKDTSPIASLLRLIAFLGTGLILLQQVAYMPQLQPRQGAAFIVLIVAVLAVGLTLLLFLPDATARMLRHTDLLVPLGLFITLSAGLSYLATLPVLIAILTSSWSVTLFTLSLSLSVSLVFMILLTAAYAGWTTILIFQVVLLRQTNLIGSLTILRQRFWRVLGLEFFGGGILFVIMILEFATSAVSFPLTLILFGITSLLWNLATIAVLPVGLADSQSFGHAIRHGMAVSRAGRRKWSPLVITQMVLLGWITFFHVTYTTYERNLDTTTYTNEASDVARQTDTEINFPTEKITTSWSVNGFWTGGYADDCKWHEKLMKTIEAEKVQLVATLLSILFTILAIAIKLRIVSDMYQPAPIHAEMPASQPT